MSSFVHTLVRPCCFRHSPLTVGGFLRTQVDEEQRPMSYSQAFQLVQDGQGQWFVYNDLFKLVYG